MLPRISSGSWGSPRAHEVLNTDLASYLGTVRPLLRTAVVATAGPPRRAELMERLGADTLVDLIVISAEEGVVEPDPAIYLRACDRLGLAPEESQFVDDTPANVDGARRVGMHAELYTTAPRPATLATHLSRAGR